MPPGFPQAQVVIWSLAFLATPGLILPAMYFRANLRARIRSPGDRVRAMHAFRLFFITLTMTSIGMVALVIWDGMFPDRRDARILTGLPLPARLLIGARLLALAALCGIFVVGVNIVPTIFYAPTIAVFGGAANLPLGVLAFVVANGLAGAFVFSALVALQGLVLNLGGRRAADRLSLALQVSFVMVLLQMVLFMPRVAAMLTADLKTGWVLALPSVWFLGLYDVIGGRPVAGSPALAGMALLATAATVGAAILLFVATHDRLTRRALESREIGGGRKGLTVENLTQVLCRRPAARAVFGFTVKTLTRSRSHRLLMAIYVGGALALVASGIVPVALTEWPGRFHHAGRCAPLGATRHRLLCPGRHARRPGHSLSSQKPTGSSGNPNQATAPRRLTASARRCSSSECCRRHCSPSSPPARSGVPGRRSLTRRSAR